MDNEKLSELINSILSDLGIEKKSEEEIYGILQTRLASVKAEYDKERMGRKSNSNGFEKLLNTIGVFNTNVFDYFGYLLLNKDESINIDKDKLKVLASCISKLQQEDRELSTKNAQLKENADNEKIRVLSEINKKVSDENLHLNSLLAKQDDELYSLLQELFGFIGENPKSEETKSFTDSIKNLLKGWSKKIEVLWSIDKEIEEDYFEIRKTKMKVDNAVKLPCICADGKVVLLGLKYMEI